MNIGEMQRKLSVWAEQDVARKFYDLYPLISRRDWLLLAHDHVAQNAGSITAGCDGITMKDFDQDLEGNLEARRKDLHAGTFAPYPVRRVYIPKANGKSRPLGIQSIRDRIVQEALRMVLEPIYEADFCPYSFGFRPNRCTMDAIKCITWSVQENKKYFWIIEGDLASYFDTINHWKLIKLLQRRVKDEKLISLLWKFLRAGVMEKKLFRDIQTGVPQGGIISPLLSNIYLHELDKYMERYTGLSRKEKTQRRSKGQANFVYVRYCDDFVVLCNGTKGQAEAMKQELHEFLHTHLKLTLSMEKTRVTHLNDGFTFLGFRLQRRLGHKGLTTKVTIPQEAVRHCLEKIRAATAASTHQDSVATKILALNRIIGGWCRYYQYTSRASKQFSKLDHTVFWWMAHWLGRKFQLSMPQVMKRYRQGNTFVWAHSRLTKAGELKITRYSKRFLQPNPYTTQTRIIQREDLPTETYWTGYETRPGTADLRPRILERDGYTCQQCGISGLTLHTSQMDHKRPVRRFKLPVNANVPENLWTLCISCHQEKTKADRQVESLVP
jgi:group II intron reverse transcriptase/maturase